MSRGGGRFPGVAIQWTRCKFDGRRPGLNALAYPVDMAVADGPQCCTSEPAPSSPVGSAMVSATRASWKLRHIAPIRKAGKLRMRLGGGPSLFEPFPGKPPRTHWRTYLRLLAAATAALRSARSRWSSSS